MKERGKERVNMMVREREIMHNYEGEEKRVSSRVRSRERVKYEE